MALAEPPAGLARGARAASPSPPPLPHPPPGDPLPLPRTRGPGGGEAPAADSALLRRTGVRGALDPVVAECGVAVREAQASQDTLRASIAQLTGSAPPPPIPS